MIGKSSAAIAFVAVLLAGCASRPVPGDAVPIAQIQIQSRFDTVEVTQSRLGIEQHKCIPILPEDSPKIREKQRLFPSKGTSWAASHLGSSKIFFVYEATAICLQRSAAGFPIYAAEMFQGTVNPVGVPEEVLDVWYKRIALLIATQGTATVAYEAPNGNAFIATYWIDKVPFGLLYSNEFKKAGEWESNHFDAYFHHADLSGVKTVSYSGRNEKMNLLFHRNQERLSQNKPSLGL